MDSDVLSAVIHETVIKLKDIQDYMSEWDGKGEVDYINILHKVSGLVSGSSLVMIEYGRSLQRYEEGLDFLLDDATGQGRR